MNDVLASAIHFALDLGLKATAIFLVTGAALLLLHRASAATRHFVGVLGLAAALVLPVLSLALPRVAVPPAPGPEAAGARRFRSRASRPGRTRGARRRSPAACSPSPCPRSRCWRPRPTFSTRLRPRRPRPPRRLRVPWFAIGLGLWAAGALAVGARLAVGWARVRRIARQASPIQDADWIEERDRAARRLALDRRVELMESEEVPVAMTSGMRRPLLFIGKVARLWEVERRRIVLLHELAHVQRGDWLALILAELAVALYWFHPVAWWIGRRVRRDAETACDDLVISAGTKPSVYAGHLLGIFRSLASPSHPRGARSRDRPPAPLRGTAAGDPGPALRPGREVPVPGDLLRRRPVDGRRRRGRGRALDASPGGQRGGDGGRVPRGGLARPVVGRRRSGRSELGVGLSFQLGIGVREPEVDCAGETKTVSASAADSAAPDETALPEEAAEPAGTVPAIWTPEPDAPPSRTPVSSRPSNRRSPRDGEDWYSRGMELHNDENYREAIAAFAKSIEAGHKEAASSYNIACGYALLGEPDRAFEWLKRAMDAGFDLSHYIDHDDDLDSLKSDPRWAEWKRLAKQSQSKSEERHAQTVVTRYRADRGEEPSGRRAVLRRGRRSPAGRPLRPGGEGLPDRDRPRLPSRDGLLQPGLRLCSGGRRRTAPSTVSSARSTRASTRRTTCARTTTSTASTATPALPPCSRRPRSFRWTRAMAGGTGNPAPSGQSGARPRPATSPTRPSTRQKGRAWFNLGYAALAGDRAQQAAEAFRKALDLGYRKPTTMYNLACTYSRLDQVDVAFDWLFKALDAGFDSQAGRCAPTTTSTTCAATRGTGRRSRSPARRTGTTRTTKTDR